MAAVLLLGIMIAAGISLLIMGSTFLQQFQASFAATSQSEIASLRERLIVSDVWFNESDRIHIGIFNTGDIDATVTEVFVDDTLVFSDGIKVEAGRFVWVNATFGWVDGQEYRVRVVTERGTAHESLWEA